MNCVPRRSCVVSSSSSLALGATKKPSVDSVDIHCMGEWTTKNYIYVYIILQPWYYITIAYMIVKYCIYIYKAVCYPSIHPPIHPSIHPASESYISYCSTAHWIAQVRFFHSHDYLQTQLREMMKNICSMQQLCFPCKETPPPHAMGNGFCCTIQNSSTANWKPGLLSFTASLDSGSSFLSTTELCLAAWVSSNFALKMMQFDSTAG